jgi:hypothetical protein
MINDHIDKYNRLVPLLKNSKKLLKTISSTSIVKELEQLIKDSDELTELNNMLRQYTYGISHLTFDGDFQIEPRLIYELPKDIPNRSIIYSKINDIVRFYILNKDSTNNTLAIGIELSLAKTIIYRYQNILGKSLNPNIEVIPLLKKEEKEYDTYDYFIILNECLEPQTDYQKRVIDSYREYFINEGKRHYLQIQRYLIGRYYDFYSAINQTSKILEETSNDDEEYKKLIQNYKLKHNNYSDKQIEVEKMSSDITLMRISQEYQSELEKLYMKEKMRILNDYFKTSEHSQHPYVVKNLVELYELKKSHLGGNSNTEPMKTAKKEILGKERCIYKKAGDRKEYVKHKGNLITVNDYRKLMKR